MKNSKKGLVDFENAEDFALFRKTIYTMYTDNVFVTSSEDVDYEYSDIVIPNHIKISLFFNKINNDTCREVVTGRLFYRTYDDRFYNEESGLYFDFEQYFERAIGHEKIINEKIDAGYKTIVNNYFDKYIKLKRIDDDYLSQSEYLMLKMGRNYRK